VQARQTGGVERMRT